MKTTETKISVVVCTYNRAELLPDCLNSLVNLETSRDIYEVIVIDNNSDDGTKNIVNEYINKYSNFNYYFEPNQGLSHARNLGMNKAAADFIAYIDDDVRVKKNWLKKALEIIESKDPDVFGGPVYPLFTNKKPEWYKDKYAIRGDMGETGWIKKGYIIGSNFFIRKTLLKEYNGFDPDLGMKGTQISYHEETKIVFKAFEDKRKVYYSTDLTVFDLVPDYKQNIIYFITSFYKDGYTNFSQDLDSDNYDLLYLVNDIMNDFNYSLFSRDKNKFKYPENYLFERERKKLIKLGKLTKTLINRKQLGNQKSLNQSNKNLMEPKLSIIIANYNKGNYIRECLESVFSQSFRDFEIVIVDDGSTDESISILKEYELNFPNKVKVLYLKKNRGVSIARNMAISYSKGEYITALDSDDFYYNKNKLNKEMLLIEAYKIKGENIIAFSTTVQVDRNGNFEKRGRKNNLIQEGNIFDRMITKKMVRPRDFIFKKSIYFEIGGYDLINNFMAEDLDLVLRLAKEYNFFHSGITGTAYRNNVIGCLSNVTLKERYYWIKKITDKNLLLVKSTEERKKLKTESNLVIKNKFKNQMNRIIKFPNSSKLKLGKTIYKQGGINGLFFLIKVIVKKKLFNIL